MSPSLDGLSHLSGHTSLDSLERPGSQEEMKSPSCWEVRVSGWRNQFPFYSFMVRGDKNRMGEFLVLSLIQDAVSVCDLKKNNFCTKRIIRESESEKLCKTSNILHGKYMQRICLCIFMSTLSFFPLSIIFLHLFQDLESWLISTIIGTAMNTGRCYSISWYANAYFTWLCCVAWCYLTEGYGTLLYKNGPLFIWPSIKKKIKKRKARL